MVHRFNSIVGKRFKGLTLLRLFPLLLVGILVVALAMPSILTRGAGSTPQTTVVKDTNGSTAKEQDIPLKTLGIQDYELRSPSASAQFRFTIPDNWEVESGELHLSVDYIQSGDLTNVPAGTSIMSTFDVTLDNRIVDSVHFTNSTSQSQDRPISLPPGMLKDDTHRNHTVRLSLDAAQVCQVNIDTRVIVHADSSFLRLKYQESTPTLDLATYPHPFYNGSALAAESSTVILVMPPNKTAADLNTAASIAAGLGSLTYDQVKIRAVDADKLTDDDRKNNNLMIIGLPDTNPLLKSLYDNKLLPTQLNSDGTLSQDQTPVNATDGVLQLIANPDDPMHSILTVTGQTAEGMAKAAQALTNLPASMALSGPVALVSDVRPVAQLPVGTTLSPKMTFADLGYTEDDLKANGRGTRFLEIAFNLPVDSQLTKDAYVNLVYNGSQALQGEKTTVSLTMNGIPFASAMLQAPGTPTSDQQPPQRTLHAQIPADAVNPGQKNVLAIVVDTQGNWGCNPPSDYGIWFSASPTSEINIPTQPAASTITFPLVNWFPSPFNSIPDLHNVWISLPTQPSQSELEQALNLVARIGSSTDGGKNFAPQINLGDFPDGTDLSQYNIIAIGRPSTNPVVAKLNPTLPQPFAPNSDDLQQLLDNVSYRVSHDYTVGVIETLKSPWSGNRVVLVITGNSDKGQQTAGDALISGNFGRDQLKGDVVFASGNAVSPVDSRKIQNAVAMLTQVPDLATKAALAITQTPAAPDGPTATPTLLYTLTPTVTQPTAIPTYPPLPPDQVTPGGLARPGGVSALLGITLAAIAGILLFGAFRAVRWMQARGA